MKKKKKKEETTEQKYNGLAYYMYRAAIATTKIITAKNTPDKRIISKLPFEYTHPEWPTSTENALNMHGETVTSHICGRNTIAIL